MTGKRLMTPQEIQRMMDFILRSEANAAVRREKFEEEFEARHAKIQRDIDDLAAQIRNLLKTQREHTKTQREYAKSQRNYEKRMRALEASDRRTRRRVEGIKDLMRLFSERSDIHSKRLDRLERNGR
jgi:hypothetical protein